MNPSGVTPLRLDLMPRGGALLSPCEMGSLLPFARQMWGGLLGRWSDRSPVPRHHGLTAKAGGAAPDPRDTCRQKKKARALPVFFFCP